MTKMMIKFVAIVYGDNDYHNTFWPLMESIKRVIEWNPDIEARILKYIIEQGMNWHYIAFMNSDPEAKYHNFNFDDLKILFNEEALEETLKDHNHGAWLLDVDQNKVIAF